MNGESGWGGQLGPPEKAPGLTLQGLPLVTVCLKCEKPLVLTHLARCTHRPIQWRTLLCLAKVGVIWMAAPQLFAGVEGPELEENTIRSVYQATLPPQLTMQNVTPSPRSYNLDWSVNMPVWVGAASSI